MISESGEFGATTTLTIVAKASFGRGAQVRRRLLELVSERLEGVVEARPNKDAPRHLGGGARAAPGGTARAPG